jgi:hypothetical protein
MSLCQMYRFCSVSFPCQLFKILGFNMQYSQNDHFWDMYSRNKCFVFGSYSSCTMPILEIKSFPVTCHHVLPKCARWLSSRGDRLVVQLENLWPVFSVVRVVLSHLMVLDCCWVWQLKFMWLAVAVCVIFADLSWEFMLKKHETLYKNVLMTTVIVKQLWCAR